MKVLELTPQPLTREAFAPFGDLLDPEAAQERFEINDGYAQRFHALAEVETEGGQTIISIFRAKPQPLPLKVEMLERHPLGSQAFAPLHRAPFLILVAPSHKAKDAPDFSQLRLFISEPGQGINFHRNTWHHPLITLNEGCDFLVIDRAGPEQNCDIQLCPPSIVARVLPLD